RRTYGRPPATEQLFSEEHTKAMDCPESAGAPCINCGARTDFLALRYRIAFYPLCSWSCLIVFATAKEQDSSNRNLARPTATSIYAKAPLAISPVRVEAKMESLSPFLVGLLHPLQHAG